MRGMIAAMSMCMSAAGLAWPLHAHAGAFEVAPTTIMLPSSARSGALYVTNRANTPVNLQVEAYDWKQPENGEVLTPSTDLLVSPPMLRLGPGRKQTVRLAMNPTADASKEHSFRLLVSELPDSSTQKSDQGVAVLLQFSVPVFITGTDQSPAALEWDITRDAQGGNLSVVNNGAAHAKLNSIALAHENGKEITVTNDKLNYVLAGGTRRWKLGNDALTPGETLTLTTQDENDGAIHARIPVPN